MSRIPFEQRNNPIVNAASRCAADCRTTPVHRGHPVPRRWAGQIITPVVFAEYAANAVWTADHIGQFIAMAVLLAGLVALFYVVDIEDGTARWTGHFRIASAVAAFAL